jgi:hypothetical protein
LLDVADGLVWLTQELGIGYTSCQELVGFSREELQANGWLSYPKLSRLAQVAPLNLTEQKFLSRCKEIHELWQRLPHGVLRRILEKSGHDRRAFKEFRSMKLIHLLTNVIERLNANHETVANFDADCQPNELTDRNVKLAPLFLTADLRNADAHNGGSILKTLSEFGFDITQVNVGYGTALDHTFDQNIASFAHIASEINILRHRSL